ncbi:hypothetical protein [Larsenimonas salina]|uniref:hypothetical protein n=1 Tax=Larsenimonas salina TaxID=1295565 RepID=UPI002073B296|nr:hypothetical protein [Larsenimonas salina]MCM5705025.1 hypothetical protein [Larsenimonas salina]
MQQRTIRTRARHAIFWLSALEAGMVMTAPAQAAVTDLDYIDPGIQEPSAPHTLYESNSGVRLYGGFKAFAFGAATKNANFGATRSIGGSPTRQNPGWWEATAMPTLRFELDTGRSKVFAGLTAVTSMTRGNRYGDASGATPDHPENARIDRAYVGWQSGTLFDALDDDAITLSLGRQQFMFGEGFLIGDGFTDTGKYGGYYIGASQGFKNAAVASFDSGGVHADLFRLEADKYKQGGPNVETTLNGINASYTFAERAKLGGAYLKIEDSDTQSRDGMAVWNVRLKGRPLERLPGWALGGQYVHERNDAQNLSEHAWYLQSTYTFTETPWRPELAYRYAEFSPRYDTLFYEFAGGWGNWFMGEVVGEYMLFNSNLKVDMLKASIAPRDDLETGLLAYRFRLDDADVAGAGSDEFAKELDVYANWRVSERLTLLGIYGVALPDEGAEDIFGRDEPSQIVEVLATYEF